MKCKLSILLSGIVIAFQLTPIQGQSLKSAFPSKTKDKQEGKLVIEEQLNADSIKTDSLELQFTAVVSKGDPEFQRIKQKVSKGYVKWVIPTDEPLWVSINCFKTLGCWLVEPGDSIYLRNDKNGVVISGKGAEKCMLQHKMDSVERSVPPPSNPVNVLTLSLADYLEWSKYLDKKIELVTSLVDAEKHRISPFAFDWLKAAQISAWELYRSNKFGALAFIPKIAKKEGLSSRDLCNIFDSTFYSAPAKWMRSLPIGAGDALTEFASLEVAREMGFDRARRKGISRIEYMSLVYERGKKIYHGLTRERFFVLMMTDGMIDHLRFTSETEKLLAKYYTEPGYPEFKQFVKEYEIKERKLEKGMLAPAFSSSDVKGSVFSSEKLKGKVVLLDFWFTGCKACVQMVPAIRKVEEKFKNDTNMLFLSVSTDKNKAMWMESISKGKYTTGNGINLLADDDQAGQSVIKAYNVTGYPELHLVDGYGKIVMNPLPDPRSDSGLKLTELIGKELQILRDGPYIIYGNDSTSMYSIHGSAMTVRKFPGDDNISFDVQADEYNRSFKVSLKKKLEIESSVFDKPEKLLVFSDIEGNFSAFRRLLQANNVIDQDYNWIFGNGHLILNGDMFDRGQQVTECLWLIYCLEEKAKAAGGYVHFILGNHEIMNLSGHHKYVEKKYKLNTEKMRLSYTDLYAASTELGKWLRTKNIMEKIGDLLFVHGGVGEEVAKLSLSIPQMNNLARPYYDKDSIAEKSSNKALALLFNTEKRLSPFWHRSYYLNDEQKIKVSIKGLDIRLDTIYKTPLKVIDDVLDRFGVNRIITGHTMVGNGDMVTAHYGDKVINTDTWHADGKSEGLLIEMDKYYRVNIEGEKKLLFYSSFAAAK